MQASTWTSASLAALLLVAGGCSEKKVAERSARLTRNFGTQCAGTWEMREVGIQNSHGAPISGATLRDPTVTPNPVFSFTATADGAGYQQFFRSRAIDTAYGPDTFNNSSTYTDGRLRSDSPNINTLLPFIGAQNVGQPYVTTTDIPQSVLFNVLEANSGNTVYPQTVESTNTLQPLALLTNGMMLKTYTRSGTVKEIRPGTSGTAQLVDAAVSETFSGASYFVQLPVSGGGSCDLFVGHLTWTQAPSADDSVDAPTVDEAEFSLIGSFTPQFALDGGLTPSQVVATARNAVVAATAVPPIVLAAAPTF